MDNASALLNMLKHWQQGHEKCLVVGVPRHDTFLKIFTHSLYRKNNILIE